MLRGVQPLRVQIKDTGQPLLSVDHESARWALQAVPLYLSEIAPPKMRGFLNQLFQLATTVGCGAAGSAKHWRVLRASIICFTSVFLARRV